MLHSLEYYGDKYSVILTKHTRETRVNEFIPRDALVYPQLCHKLLHTALQHGLTSLRNKLVVVTARVGLEYAVSFVVILSYTNQITVMSILNHPFVHYNIYRTISDRINLYSLVFDKVSVAQASKLRARQVELKKPKSFKKSGVPKQRLTYKEDSALMYKKELEEYTTTHDYKRKL